MKKEVKIWMLQAENDYSNMQLLWEHSRYSGCIFFAQQAVEKIIKAYFIGRHNSLPSKTHRIEKLLKDSGLDIKEVAIKTEHIEELSKSYIRVRYPDLDDQYYSARSKVEPLVRTAQKVFPWIKEKLITL